MHPDLMQPSQPKATTQQMWAQHVTQGTCQGWSLSGPRYPPETGQPGSRVSSHLEGPLGEGGSAEETGAGLTGRRRVHTGHSTSAEPLTQQVDHEVRAGGEGVGQIERRVAAALDLPQSLEVPQQNVPEPLRVHAGDPPLFGFFIL